jgi:hypothetical protein
MMTRIGASTPPVYKASVKIAQAPPQPEDLEQPPGLAGRTTESLPPKPTSGGTMSPSNGVPRTTIEQTTDRTINDGGGNPILEESSSRTTSINRTPPTADLKIKRTRIDNRTNGTSQETTALGAKVSITGTSGSASVDLSDSNTVVDHIPVNTAIGRTDGNTCKLTQKTADGKVIKFEAKKPEGGVCIEGQVPLTPNNHIKDGDTTVFTQQSPHTPAGVTIEYKQIPKQ